MKKQTTDYDFGVRDDLESQLFGNNSLDASFDSTFSSSLFSPMQENDDATRPKTAVECADQVKKYTSVVQSNHDEISKALGYFTHPCSRVSYDTLSFVSGLLGKVREKPSLPKLLDTQEKALGEYESSLGQMITFVEGQRKQVEYHVDALEERMQVQPYRCADERLISLKEEFKNSPTQAVKREIMDELFAEKRSKKNIELSQAFFAEYVAQENLLREFGYGLTDISEQARAFKLYVAASKGSFVTYHSISDAIAQFTPTMNIMYDHMNLLRDKTLSAVQNIVEEGKKSIFSQGAFVSDVETMLSQRLQT